MSAKPNNPPAFPVSAEQFVNGLQGMTMRDYFAAKETLDEWDNPEAVMSDAMASALAGEPKPEHGWNCKSPEQWIAFLKWEAKWRSALKYIRADAMLAEREKGQQ